MSEFTKEHWGFDLSKNGAFIYKPEPNGGAIAIIPMEVEEWEANAHLIKASPKLYEALKVARRWLKERLTDDHVDMEMIDKALAEAEGK